MVLFALLFVFSAPARSVEEYQADALPSPSVGLEQHKANHADDSAIYGQLEKNADQMDDRVVFVFRSGVYGDLNEPTVGAGMALAACLFDIGFIDRGAGGILLIDIMQGIGSMATDAVSRFLRAQFDQFAMDGLVVGNNSLQGSCGDFQTPHRFDILMAL